MRSAEGAGWKTLRQKDHVLQISGERKITEEVTLSGTRTEHADFRLLCFFLNTQKPYVH